jgi:hypothetical protein
LVERLHGMQEVRGFDSHRLHSGHHRLHSPDLRQRAVAMRTTLAIGARRWSNPAESGRRNIPRPQPPGQYLLVITDVAPTSEDRSPANAADWRSVLGSRRRSRGKRPTRPHRPQPQQPSQRRPRISETIGTTVPRPSPHRLKPPGYPARLTQNQLVRTIGPVRQRWTGRPVGGIGR